MNENLSNKSNNKNSKIDFSVQANPNSNIKKVIAVLSGKGGVGKSLVTSMMASEMQRLGYKTAILDADITGPSIPKTFGITGKAFANELGMIPVNSKTGIKIMSINVILGEETDPVVWRGPLIGSTVKQFWTEVVWGDIDFMFIDMPPGTGDVALTVFQSFNIDGIIIVTSPQELVSMIVSKAVKMAELMNIPILGLVENMAYYQCPKCNEKINIFGKSHSEEAAKSHNLEVIAKLPIDSKIAKACDLGKIEDYKTNALEGVSNLLKNLGENNVKK